MTKTSLDKNKIKILLLEGVHPSALEAFRADGYTDIEYHQKSLPEAKLLEVDRRRLFHRHPLGHASHRARSSNTPRA